MSNPHIVSIAVAKPKVFRLPPAPSVPVKKTKSSSAWKWRLMIALAALGLLWPPLHKQATAYFSSQDGVKNGSVDHDALEGVLQPGVADAQAMLPAEKPPTILLRGQSEAIIGQMAKIPSESEPIVETRAASNVDNTTGRELLSIVSKY